MSITALKTMKANSNKKIDVASITRTEFILRNPNKELLIRYFRVDNRYFDRIHIPALTEEEYTKEVKSYISKGKSMSKENMQFDTASSYYKQKMAKERLAKDLNVSVSKLDFSSYIWNEDYFAYYDLLDSADYADRKFMEEPDETPTVHDVYIKFDTHQSVLDKELFDELYRFCSTAITKRKAMLLMKVEQCVSTLANIIEQTNGFSMNVSGNTLRTLEYYKAYFEEILSDTEYAEFIANNNDITVYAIDSNTHTDYIETYAYLVKKLVGIKSEDTYMEDFIRSVLYNPDDDYIDEIVENCFTIPDKIISYVEDFEE